jgi:hypothetical protein
MMALPVRITHRTCMRLSPSVGYWTICFSDVSGSGGSRERVEFYLLYKYTLGYMYSRTFVTFPLLEDRMMMILT